jgi:hypothetical protein
LDRIPLGMKPFVPQLQRVIVTLLSDEEESVIESAMIAYRKFITALKPSIEPLIRDLRREMEKAGGQNPVCLVALY